MSDAAGDGLIERLRRDFYVKKGDVFWRKRAVDRFQGPHPEASMKSWNAQHAGKPAGKLKRGRRIVIVDGKTWSVADLVRAVDTGVLPVRVPCGGNPYHGAIHIGEGPLAAEIGAACASSGFTPADLTVLYRDNDPFRLDTPAAHRDAAWFAEHLDRLLGERRVHLHGLHYVLVAAGGVVKPNGEMYRNTHADDDWLVEAGKRARWLGYVSFDRIDDNRNDEPVIFRPERPRPTWINIGASIGSYAKVEIEGDAEAYDVRPSPYLHDFAPRQPYAFAFFGEKSSLDPVLRPLAERYRADMYLGAGELSDTLIWRMARDAVDDGRPLIVFSFSDFDPAGVQMPISIARKLQALKALLFPDLRGQVVAVSLTLDQAIEQRLPTTPVKIGEKRRDRWQQAYGPALFEAGLIEAPDRAAQVEIDALAALRPEELTRIAEAEIGRYVDPGLPRRFARAHAIWTEAAAQAVNAQLDDSDVADLQERTEYAIERYNHALKNLRQARDDLNELQGEGDALAADIDPPESPEAPEPEIDEAAHDPLLDLDWDFVTATQALKARRAYEDEGGAV
jgi:hypothetical protein